MPIKKGIIAISAAALLAGAAYAQSPAYDPNQLPAYNGRVQQFTLTGRGDIDGIILSDGTEVKVPPHLSTQIAAAFRVGDAITVRGLRAAAMPLVEASSVKNDATGQTVVDNGPPPGPKGRLLRIWDRATGQVPQISGRVRMSLHGPRGDINGALLEDGTVIRMPPREAYRLSALLTPGQTVSVQGDVTETVFGKVVEASAIGQSGTTLNQVDGPPPPGPAGLNGAPPPPPGPEDRRAPPLPPRG